MALLTQGAIMNAFTAMLEEMPFDKITVTALVRRAGISSNTFYYHYEDIYALLEAWLRQTLGVRSDGTGDWTARTRDLLYACRANPRVTYHVFDSLSRDLLERYVFSLTGDVFYQEVCRRAAGRAVPEAYLREITDFCRYAYVGFVMQFLWERMEGDIDGKVERLSVLFFHFVDSSLALF